nr:TraX family protein [Paenibacillus daejeonensis]
MQIVAMLTMLIDHVGLVFFPGDPLWRIIGRLAFPLYTYALVLGFFHTSNMKRYMLRLTVIAVISQIPYQWALHSDDINVVGTLLVSLLALVAMQRWSHPALMVLIGCLAAYLLETLNFNYGYYGLALVLIYRYSQSHMQLLLHFLLNLSTLFAKFWETQLYSIFATAFLVYWPAFYRAFDRIPMPRWVWRSFYPGHLVLLGVAQFLIPNGL